MNTDIWFYITYIILSNLYCISLFLYFTKYTPVRTNFTLFIVYSLIANSLVMTFALELFYPLQMVMVFAFTLITSFIFFHSPIQEKLLSCSLYVFLLLSSQAIINSLYVLLSQTSFYATFKHFTLENHFITLLSLVLALFVLYLFTKIFKIHKIKVALEDHFITNILTFALLFGSIFLTLSTLIYYVDDSSFIVPSYHMILSILLLVSYMSFSFYLINLVMVNQIELKNKILENQLTTQKNHYNRNMEYIAALRVIKHDYFDLLHTLEYSLLNYSKADLKQLVKKLQTQLREMDKQFSQYSNDPLVDSIILDANILCKELNIALEALISIPEDTPFNEEELCILFAILLNNAIALVEVSSVEAKKIQLSNRIHANWFTIQCLISNDIPQTEIDKLFIKNAFFLVEEIVEKYQGFIENSMDETTMMQQIQICIPK